jgi:hypothetical protein
MQASFFARFGRGLTRTHNYGKKTGIAWPSQDRPTAEGSLFLAGHLVESFWFGTVNWARPNKNQPLDSTGFIAILPRSGFRAGG